MENLMTNLVAGYGLQGVIIAVLICVFFNLKNLQKGQLELGNQIHAVGLRLDKTNEKMDDIFAKVSRLEGIEIGRYSETKPFLPNQKDVLGMLAG
jgi:hypothetical protein